MKRPFRPKTETSYPIAVLFLDGPIAEVGEVIASLRWWSFAEPPANEVRPLPGSKPRPPKT
jgi:hypothetical protein